MQGIIFRELQGFVESQFGGPATWKKLMSDAGLGDKSFNITGTYPDEELVALVTAASKATGKDARTLIEAFGRHIVAGLLRVFGPTIPADWKTLEVVERAEGHIHRGVRLRNPTADPPALRCKRVAPNEVVVEYDSARKLCDLARGICLGLGEHYKEKIEVTEPQCMHDGAAQCVIKVKRLE